MHSIFTGFGQYILLAQIFRGTTPISPPRDISFALRHVRLLWPQSRSSIRLTYRGKTGKMKAVILAYCKQRQISMVYYFGLVVSEKANGKGSAYGEYGQFGYKVDARRASGAVALRHKKRNATGSHEHQQLLWHDFRQHRCRKLPTAAFPDPPNAPEALPTRQRSKPQQRQYKTRR